MKLNWDQDPNHKTLQAIEHSATASLLLLSTHVFRPPCLVISYTQIPRGPSQHKSGLFKQQIPLNIPKQSKKITCQCTNPFHHLVRATPKTTRKPFRGHGRIWWPRPPWPPQRSAARPRRHGPSQSPHAAPSRLGRRGYADGGAAAAAVEKQGVPKGMFLQVGAKF